MNPVLFSADASSWDSFGIGVLSDAISCIVEEERNGSYELEMEYPITGAFYSQIGFRSLIVAKPNFADNPQPFRVYQISKPLNGIVTINAEHISYDLSGYANDTFTAQGIQAAMSGIISGNTRPVNCPFIFSSDMSKTQTMSIGYPVSIRAAMGGIAGSMIDVYGGEWHFDGYHCILNAARGANRGVRILYGKNLTSLVQEANNANVYTAVMPYYYNKDTGDKRVLTEKTIQVPGTFTFQRVLPLDLTSEFEELPSEAQLRTRAAKYIEDNNIGVPKVNLTVGFQYLEGLADRIDLCDTVSVGFDALGVSATAKCIRTKWDVLKDRYIEVELGSARKSLAGTIAETSEIEKEITKYSSEYKATTERIANTVTGNTGGYIVLNDTDNDGKPDEILIMDSPSKGTAVNVIRMNSSGIAFSKTGYNGTYSTAWNINSEFSADFIAAGQLKTNLVEIYGDTNFKWDDANIEIKDPTNALRLIRIGQYDGNNYGIGFSIDGGQTWITGLDFTGIVADAIKTGTLNADRIGSGTLKTNLVEIVGDAQFRWDDSNIEIIKPKDDPDDPDEPLKIIRLGKYDGVNYGLGFSIDGGSTWVNGFDFNGIKAIGGISGGKFELSGDSLIMTSSSNVTMMLLGLCTKARNTQGEQVTQSIYQIGSFTTLDLDGNAISEPSRGIYSVSIGRWMLARGAYSVNIGCTSRALENYSVVIGYLSQASDVYGIAIGYNNRSVGEGSIAFGNGNTASTGNTIVCSAIALGKDCEAKHYGAIAIGVEGKANNQNGIAIGYKCNANTNGIAIGSGATSSDGYGIALGNGSAAFHAVAVGCDAEASNNYAIAIGNKCKATAYNAIAIGALSEASTNNAIAIGNTSKVTGDSSVAIGYNNTITNNYSAAIGNDHNVSGYESVATGRDQSISANYAFGAGAHNTIAGEGALVAGSYNTVNNSHGFVTGTNNTTNAAHPHAAIFGHHNNSSCANQLIIGCYSNPAADDMFVVAFGNSSTRRNLATIKTSGNMWILGTLSQASDRRLKKITGEAPDLSSVRAVKFEWKDKELQDSAEHIGYIAQDVEEIAPYLVKEDKSGTKSLDYIAVLCAKVEMLERQNAEKEQRISDLEQIISKLSERLESLEGRLA